MTEEAPRVPAMPLAAHQMLWGFEPVRSDQGQACVIVRISHPLGSFQNLVTLDDFEVFATAAIEAVKKARRLPPKLITPGMLPPDLGNGRRP
jgi:hypothetical protein